ncbi:hypothetical protein [Salinicoccus sp. HZC-1]|uniref:hypothetical protein n=1 Tax=Salinicoccus sp. HZC-1 TaxID=3385497 RepID=UPI00398B9ED2
MNYLLTVFGTCAALLLISVAISMAGDGEHIEEILMLITAGAAAILFIAVITLLIASEFGVAIL